MIQVPIRLLSVFKSRYWSKIMIHTARVSHLFPNVRRWHAYLVCSIGKTVLICFDKMAVFYPGRVQSPLPSFGGRYLSVHRGDTGKIDYACLSPWPAFWPMMDTESKAGALCPCPSVVTRRLKRSGENASWDGRGELAGCPVGFGVVGRAQCWHGQVFRVNSDPTCFARVGFWSTNHNYNIFHIYIFELAVLLLCTTSLTCIIRGCHRFCRYRLIWINPADQILLLHRTC